jgi:hypothetical protein
MNAPFSRYGSRVLSVRRFSENKVPVELPNCLNPMKRNFAAEVQCFEDQSYDLYRNYNY